jgi:hypothetical protein
LFVGVAVAPANRAHELHATLTRWAFRVSPVPVLMLAFATRHDAKFRPIAANLWMLLSFALAAYVAMMAWGPNVATDFGLVVQATAQKTIVIVAEIVIVLETYEGERALRQR